MTGLLLLLGIIGFSIQGFVGEEGTGSPIVHAVIEIEELGLRVGSDNRGEFLISNVPPGIWAVSVTALGYEPLTQMVNLTEGGALLELRLSPRPVEIAPVNVTTRRPGSFSGMDARRELHEREVLPGVVGISRSAIRSMPVLAEPDLQRSLQALPGVTALNDYNAALHVRGGGPDQNVFLLDGARIYAPFHLFGMMGALNADAIEDAELFRGAPPARFGGGLSSVVDVRQRTGDTSSVRELEGGVSLLGVRALTAGHSAEGNLRWMLAGRRTHADVLLPLVSDSETPYAFHDVQGRLDVRLNSRHRIRIAFFDSNDRYQWFLDELGEGLYSTWGNSVASAKWNWALNGAWDISVVGSSSGYHGSIAVGAGASPPETRNSVASSTVHASITGRGAVGSLHAGIAVETFRTSLRGNEEMGGFFQGEVDQATEQAAAFLEAAFHVGPLHLAPGVRAVYEENVFRLEPRFGLRLAVTGDLALSAGVSRTYQSMSTLRDDRFLIPGAPMWFIHPSDFGAALSDGFSLALDGFVGDSWSYSIGTYARHFAGVPRWQPDGLRNLSALRRDIGEATGVEFLLHRHAGSLTGWVGYEIGRVELQETDSERDYFAAWDQTHSVNAAAFLQVTPEIIVSGQVMYGSGLPFWQPSGFFHGHRFDPLRATVAPSLRYPMWSDEQGRLPPYLRLDLGARSNFLVRGVVVEPFFSITNVTNQQNVLAYRAAVRSDGEDHSRPFLYPLTQLMAFPSIGVDLRF